MNEKNEIKEEKEEKIIDEEDKKEENITEEDAMDIFGEIEERRRFCCIPERCGSKRRILEEKDYDGSEDK